MVGLDDVRPEIGGGAIQRGRERLTEINVGDSLDGSPEPTMSAPTTANGKRLKSRK